MTRKNVLTKRNHSILNGGFSVHVFILLIVPIALSGSAYGGTQSLEPELLDLLQGDLQIEPNFDEAVVAAPETELLQTNDVKPPEDTLLSPKKVVSVSKNISDFTGTSKTSAERQLWKSRISVSQSATPSSVKTELESIIQQINSIEIVKKEKTVPNAELIEQLPPAIEKQSDALNAEQSEQDAAQEMMVQTQVPEGVVSEETLALLKAQIQESRWPENSLELAETLYEGGCLKEAAECYKHALTQIKGDDLAVQDDKAWIMLQIGNCLRDDQPEAALETYGEIVLNYPESLWAELAKSKSRLMKWYLEDRPKKQIENAASQKQVVSQ